MEENLINNSKITPFTLNSYLNENVLNRIKKYYVKFISIWTVFAFFIILNAVIDVNNITKEKINIYQTTNVKVNNIYRNGKLLTNNLSPIYYNVTLPTKETKTINISSNPTKKEIKNAKQSDLTNTKYNTHLAIKDKFTLYEVSIIQADKKAKSVYVTNLTAAKGQQQLLANTKKNALLLVFSNTIQYLLMALMIVIGGVMLIKYLKKNTDDFNSNSEIISVANTQESYVQLSK